VSLRDAHLHQIYTAVLTQLSILVLGDCVAHAGNKLCRVAVVQDALGSRVRSFTHHLHHQPGARQCSANNIKCTLTHCSVSGHMSWTKCCNLQYSQVLKLLYLYGDHQRLEQCRHEHSGIALEPLSQSRRQGLHQMSCLSSYSRAPVAHLLQYGVPQLPQVLKEAHLEAASCSTFDQPFQAKQCSNTTQQSSRPAAKW